MNNQKSVQEEGLEKFIAGQNLRITILEKILQYFNDGKNKSFFCNAAALLDIQSLNNAIARTENEINAQQIAKDDLRTKSRILREVLTEYAQEKNIELKLQK